MKRFFTIWAVLVVVVQGLFILVFGPITLESYLAILIILAVLVAVAIAMSRWFLEMRRKRIKEKEARRVRGSSLDIEAFRRLKEALPKETPEEGWYKWWQSWGLETSLTLNALFRSGYGNPTDVVDLILSGGSERLTSINLIADLGRDRILRTLENYYRSNVR